MSARRCDLQCQPRLVLPDHITQVGHRDVIRRDGTVEAYRVINPATKKHFGGSTSEIPFLDGRNGYIALTAFVLNLVITVGLTLLLRAAGVSGGRDATLPEDYTADADDPRVRRLPVAAPG